MAAYYVNNDAQPNGDHEVHKAGCHWMASNRLYLDDFTNCQDAVREAKKTYRQSNGSIHCSSECHTN